MKVFAILNCIGMYPPAIPFSCSSVFCSILLSDPLKKLQITYSLLFSLVVALISDALRAVPDKTSVLSRDASFRQEFQESVSRQPSLNVFHQWFVIFKGFYYFVF